MDICDGQCLSQTAQALGIGMTIGEGVGLSKPPPLCVEGGLVTEIQETTNITQPCCPRMPCVHLY